jgi:hypothetical protein
MSILSEDKVVDLSSKTRIGVRTFMYLLKVLRSRTNVGQALSMKYTCGNSTTAVTTKAEYGAVWNLNPPGLGEFTS